MIRLSREEIYDKHADELVRFATGLVGPGDAGDVVSNAVVAVMWSPRWDRIENPRAYLYRAVLNEARRQHRRTMRRSAVEARAAETDEGRIPEVRPEVLEAVSRLSVAQRAVVFLAYWEDMKPAEIARHLGLSDGTVHRNLARGQERLRRILSDR